MTFEEDFIHSQSFFSEATKASNLKRIHCFWIRITSAFIPRRIKLPGQSILILQNINWITAAFENKRSASVIKFHQWSGTGVDYCWNTRPKPLLQRNFDYRWTDLYGWTGLPCHSCELWFRKKFRDLQCRNPFKFQISMRHSKRIMLPI